MTSDLRVLSFQMIIKGHEWDRLKRDPELMERYVRANARQHIAAEIADKRLCREVLSEPDPQSDDPMRQTNAVLRLTVAVAAKDEAAVLARELAEAEDRGFQRAISEMRKNLEQFAPRLGPTAYARAALEALIYHVTERWDHRVAADWRPMRTAPYGGGVEYLFANGKTGREPRLYVALRPNLSTADFGDDCTTTAEVNEQVLEAIGWRYAGRPPHTVQAA